MEWLKKVRDWFTPARRAAVYAVAVAIVPLLNSLGIIPTEAGDAWLTIVNAALQVLAGVLMLTNLTWHGAADWFTTSGRAAIYSLLVTVAPALQVIGLVTPEQTEVILHNTSNALAVLVTIVAAIHMAPKQEATIVFEGRAPKIEGP